MTLTPFEKPCATAMSTSVCARNAGEAATSAASNRVRRMVSRRKGVRLLTHRSVAAATDRCVRSLTPYVSNSRPRPASSGALLTRVLDPLRQLRPLLRRQDRLRLGHRLLSVRASFIELRPERAEQRTRIGVRASLVDHGLNRVGHQLVLRVQRVADRR